MREARAGAGVDGERDDFVFLLNCFCFTLIIFCVVHHSRERAETPEKYIILQTWEVNHDMDIRGKSIKDGIK